MFRGQETVEYAEISKDIWMIDEQAGLIYLVKGRDKCAVIDTGCDDTHFYGFIDYNTSENLLQGEFRAVVKPSALNDFCD